MKTHLNQIFTIVGFFSLSIGTTLVISWGMTNVFYTNDLAQKKPEKSIILHKANTHQVIDLSRSIKLLIPKLNK